MTDSDNAALPATHDLLARGMDRRAFMRIGLGAAGAGLAGAFLSACGTHGGTSKPAAGSSQSLTPVSLQLVYLENTQFAGSYFAEVNGYYKQGGLAVTLLPGGPSIAPEPIVASGRALMGITHTNEAVQAIANGAPLSIVGAGYQKNPFCLISRASAPIDDPHAMIGKKIGVSISSQPIWLAFLKANGIDPRQIDVVTVQFDPTPLASVEIDGLIGFYTNEPIILETKGTPVHTFLLNDFGFPELEELYIVRSADLKDPAKLKLITALLRAESMGWQQAVTNPSEAARLSTYQFGKNLHLIYEQQVLEAKAQVALVTGPVTEKHGLFWMDPADVDATLHSLSLGGVTGKSSMFTNQVLEAIYHGGTKP